MLYIDIVLSDDQRSALIDRNVNFSEMALGSEAYHRRGIAFPESDCEAVLSVLGLVRDEEVSDSTLKTPQGKPIEDYFELSLARMPTPMEPIVWTNAYARGDSDEEIFKAFQAESGLGLAIKYTDDTEFAGHRHHPGVLFVNVFSSPGEDFRLDHRSFKHGESSVIRTRKPGKEYIRIAHSDRRALAYFRGDSNGGSLWLLFHTEYDERTLLEYALYSTMRLMNPKLGAICSYKEYERIAARERYIRSAENRLQEESRQADSRVSESNEQIESARRTLVLALQEADAAKHRREELESGDTGEMLRKMKENLAKEFDDLSSSPDFESLEFEEDRVIAVTRPLKLRYEGRVYEMGKYRITVHDDGDLTIASVKGKGHPHI
ncbi:MAG TPA: hypothetical protein VFX84_03920, partial [Candidatus Saccharimonadales bacterium]|nr:hypothetical protein [Candidatus Saccharimonadales bacterium]